MASSTSANDPDSEYAFAKRAMEEGALTLARQGARIVCVRIPPIWPGDVSQNFARTFLRSTQHYGENRENRDDGRLVDQPQYDVFKA